MSYFTFNGGKSVKAIAIGVLSALAVIGAALCVIAATLQFFSGIPYDYLPYITLAADAIGIFTGAYIAAAIAGSRGLVTGAICSAAVFLIMLMIGFALDSGSPGIITVLKAVVLFVFGALGGIRGVNRRERIRIK